MSVTKIGIFIRGTTAAASLALMIAIGGSFASLTSEANAMPLAPAKNAITQSGAQDSDVTLVRDGCGRGMRFSNSRQRCVEDGGPRRDEPARVINRIINQSVGGGAGRRGDGCGRGMRFSNSRQRCVPN